MSKNVIPHEELTAPPRRWEIPQFTKNNSDVADTETHKNNNSPAPEVTPKNIILQEELTAPVQRWDKLPQFTKNNASFSAPAEPKSPRTSAFISELDKFRAQIAAGRALANGAAEAESLGRAQQQGFDQGYQDGLAKGIEEGRQQGHAQGLEQGKLTGFHQGREEGHLEGLNAGLADGRRAGFTQGVEEGRQNGLEEGRTQGHAEGQAQGYEDGKNAGLEQGLADGRQAGFAQGLEDGRRAGYAAGNEEGQRAGYAQGLENGQRQGFSQGEKELKEKLARLEKLLTLLDRPFSELDQVVEEQTVALVVLIARRVIERELQQDPSIILSVMQKALENLPVARRNLRIFLHPEDVPLIQEAWTDAENPINLISDPKIARGGCKIETDNSRIDATVEQRLNQVISQLFTETQSNGAK